MSTVEDVYWLYEHKGKNNDEFILYPTSIGESDSTCNFKRKTYITPGQECPICIEPIIRKSEAYLTACGHGFHKNCIFKSFSAKIETDCYSSFNCPMCRANTGDIHIHGKYNDCSNEFNLLDELENFWMTKDFMCCYPCNSDDHIKGMKSDCNDCLKYRKNG
jgi:hypothetical protein